MTRAAAFLISALLVASAGAAIAGGPRIVFDNETHDFGKVLYGDKVKHDFLVTNAGDQVLYIEKLHATCGCTRTIKGDAEIPPKGKTTIQAEFDTVGLRPGRKEKSIYVHSNDPARPVVKLSLLADLVRDINVEPPSLARQLNKLEDKIAFQMKLENSSDKPYAITGIKSPAGSLSASLEPRIVRVAPGSATSFKLVLNLDGERDRFYYMGRLLLETDHPREHEIELRYLIKVDKAN